MIGFRHEVGGDWGQYIRLIEESEGQSLLELFTQMDLAYGFLNWVAIKTGFGIYIINILSATLFSLGLVTFCQMQPRPWLTLVVAIPYLVTVVAMGYTRQGVAIGLAMLGLANLQRGNILKFVIWVTLAALFHKSAVILVTLAVLRRSIRPVFTILWIVVTGIILFLLILQEHLDFLINGYFEAQYQSSGASIRIAMNAIPAAIFLIFRKRFQLNAAVRTFWSWMAWSALLFVPLLLISPSSTAVDRLALYWIPIQLFVWARLPDAMGGVGWRPQIWVATVIAYSATVLFVWLVFADNAGYWLPYQFYPWVWLWQ